jgi:hypothetical protein
MKKLLIVLFSILALNGFSQLKPLAPVNGPRWLSSTPGTELRKASNYFFTGIILEGAGIVLITVGAVQAYVSGTSGNGASAIGTLMLLAGPVFNILAWVHINHAGRLMDGIKVSFGGTKNGLGLTYNL